MRVSIYIDGFNVYHVIKRFAPNCRWLNLYKMAKSIISSKQKLSEVHYFSAYADWIPSRVAKHRKYVEALKTQEIHVIMGRFKAKEKICHLCKKKYTIHEEKQTDVNIALKMLEDASENKFDTAILISGDTDFLPVITTIKRLHPDKRIGIMLPIGAKANSLKAIADFSIKMKRKHLLQNQFPQKIETPQGIISISSGWLEE